MSTKQSRWEVQNRARGLCACGREPLTTRIPHKPARRYAQCRRCLALQRKRTGYKGGRTKYGLGSPPGPRPRSKPGVVKRARGKRAPANP